MKFAKSILMGTACVMLAGFVLALIAPKTAHALVATLVQVTNTPANPVNNQDVDSPGRSPYYQTVTCYSESTNQCSAQFPVVPANKRLVVQYIASSIDTPTPLINVELVANASFISILHTLQGTDASGSNIYIASQPMLYYFEAGQQPIFVMNAKAGGFEFMSGSVTLTGYLVNLTE